MIDQFTKNICAVAVGNILEWYDFAIFGALADILGEQFFPKQMAGTALIASLSLFGSAFFMRPVGGWLMGYVGDNYGRKRALEVSVATMVIPSFLMGCLPSFQEIGWASTVCLIILRLLQGLAVGGEMTGAFVFTIEATNGSNRGVWGAVVKATGLSGTALGMGYVAFLRYHMTGPELSRWGWRVPFLTSLLMGIIASFLRSFIVETDEFKADKRGRKTTKDGKTSKLSFLDVFYVHWIEILLVVAVTAYWCVGYYTCFIWMGYYMSSLIGENTIAHAWELNIIMTLLLIGLMPLGGVLGDITCDYYKERDNGYRRVMLMGVGICTIAGAPAFYLINYGMWWSACIGQGIFALSLALYGSCLPAFVVQQFSVQFRYSGVGIAYNLSNAIFAGTAPLIQTALVMRAHGEDVEDELMMAGVSSMLPAAYLCGIALVSTGVMFWAPPVLAERRIALEKKLYHAKRSSKKEGKLPAGSLDISTSTVTTVMTLDMDTSSTPMIHNKAAPGGPSVSGSSAASSVSGDSSIGSDELSTGSDGLWSGVGNWLFGTDKKQKAKAHTTTAETESVDGGGYHSHSDDEEGAGDDVLFAVGGTGSGAGRGGHTQSGNEDTVSEMGDDVSCVGGENLGSSLFKVSTADYVSGLVRGNVLEYQAGGVGVYRGAGGGSGGGPDQRSSSGSGSSESSGVMNRATCSEVSTLSSTTASEGRGKDGREHGSSGSSVLSNVLPIGRASSQHKDGVFHSTDTFARDNSYV